MELWGNVVILLPHPHLENPGSTSGVLHGRSIGSFPSNAKCTKLLKQRNELRQV